MTKIGFIGLGIMGKPMSRNLMKAGYSLVVYSRSAETAREFADAGAAMAGSPREVGEFADTVITMLPDSPEVKEVVLGKNGLIEGMRANAMLIDMTSMDPLVSREIAAKLAGRNIRMMDAPVSGGEPKAIEGTLSIMVGCRKQDFEEFLPVLEAMGSSAVRCGEVGAGNVTKLANQIIVGANIAAVSEALVFAAKAGVEPELVFQAIRGGLARSAVLDAKAPMMLERNFAPGFRINLHIKDLGNVLNMARSIATPAPLTENIMIMMTALRDGGLGDADHSALIRFYENLAAIEVKS